MKRLRLYIAIVVLAVAAASSVGASAQVLRDVDYNSIGRISANGIVRDATGHSVGTFDSDGSVCDASGRKLGRIANLEIFDNEGTRIGYINNDGTVRDGESRVLGHINLSDGKVTNADKQTLGYARGIRVDWIACYYFFTFFDK